MDPLRKILLLPLAFVLTTCSNLRHNTLSDTKKYPWFDFEWYSANISGKQYDKLAMLVPVRANDIKAGFLMQFDLGSDATYVYGNAINSYYSPDAINSFLRKHTRSVSDAGQVGYDMQNFNLYFGNYRFTTPTYKEDYGTAVPVDSLFTATKKHLGTIGADVFKDKVLVIDYPNKKMCVLDSLDGFWNQRTEFVQAQMKRGRLHIPLTVDGKILWFLFDTGASLFPINTNKELWMQLAETTAPTDTVVGNSWGERTSFYGRPIAKKVYLGNRLLTGKYVWYSENKRLLEFNKTENIDGLAGNGYFFDEVILLDFKTSRFGIAAKQQQ